MVYRVIMSTIDNRDRAEQLAIAHDEEYLLLMKTVTTDEKALIERIRELHPYEVPEVMVLPMAEGLPSYLSWIDASVRPQEQ